MALSGTAYGIWIKKTLAEIYFEFGHRGGIVYRYGNGKFSSSTWRIYNRFVNTRKSGPFLRWDLYSPSKEKIERPLIYFGPTALD